MAKYVADVLATGHLREGDEGVPMPGHHDTQASAITCKCCGHPYYVTGRPCICMVITNWYQNDLRQVSCAHHLAEKLAEGVYRA